MDLLGKLTDLYGKHGRDYAEGAILFMEGTPGDEMYLIVEGMVQISKTYRNIQLDRQTRLCFGTDTQVLGILKNGDFFGEMALLNAEKRSATAIALTNVKLIVIGRDNFSMIVGKTNPIVLQILKSLSSRLREADAYPKFIPRNKTIPPRLGKAEAAEPKAAPEPAAAPVEAKPAEATPAAAAPAEKPRPEPPRDPGQECRACGQLSPRSARFCMSCGKVLAGKP